MSKPFSHFQLDWTIRAVDAETTRYPFGGVLIQAPYIVATDGRRMHVSKMEPIFFEQLAQAGFQDGDIVRFPKRIPAKPNYNDNRPGIFWGMALSKIEGRFPQWQQVLPGKLIDIFRNAPRFNPRYHADLEYKGFDNPVYCLGTDSCDIPRLLVCFPFDGNPDSMGFLMPLEQDEPHKPRKEFPAIPGK